MNPEGIFNDNVNTELASLGSSADIILQNLAAKKITGIARWDDFSQCIISKYLEAKFNEPIYTAGGHFSRTADGRFNWDGSAPYNREAIQLVQTLFDQHLLAAKFYTPETSNELPA